MSDLRWVYSQQVPTGQGLPLAQQDAQSAQVAVAFETDPAIAKVPSVAAAKNAAVDFSILFFMILV
jgi:hypothetical protein